MQQAGQELGGVFTIRRPPLSGYSVAARPSVIVETYRSAAGEMIAQGGLHRVSINRTAHLRYAYRLGEGGPMRRILRPPFMLCLQPAGVPLEVDGDAADYISIFLHPALFPPAARRVLDGREGNAPMARTDPVTRHLAQALVHLALAETARLPDACEPLLVEQTARAFAGAVGRLLSLPAPAAPEGGPLLPAYRLRRVVAHVEARLEDPSAGGAAPTLAELAAVAGLSPAHFGRAFKAATGLPPHRYVTERRVERARRMLAEGRLPLAEIAYAAGFASQAHFTTAFRRVLGTTPAAYRRAL